MIIKSPFSFEFYALREGNAFRDSWILIQWRQNDQWIFSIASALDSLQSNVCLLSPFKPVCVSV